MRRAQRNWDPFSQFCLLKLPSKGQIPKSSKSKQIPFWWKGRLKIKKKDNYATKTKWLLECNNHKLTTSNSIKDLKVDLLSMTCLKISLFVSVEHEEVVSFSFTSICSCLQYVHIFNMLATWFHQFSLFCTHGNAISQVFGLLFFLPLPVSDYYKYAFNRTVFPLKKRKA